MSLVSQTPTRSPFTLGFGGRFALSMAVVALVVLLALRGVLAPLARMALAARPHLPDMALLAAQPLAIKVHLAAALAALVLGAVLMLRRKGRAFHRVAGWVWVSLVSVTAGATLFITTLNHGRWSLLH